MNYDHFVFTFIFSLRLGSAVASISCIRLERWFVERWFNSVSAQLDKKSNIEMKHWKLKWKQRLGLKWHFCRASEPKLKWTSYESMSYAELTLWIVSGECSLSINLECLNRDMIMNWLDSPKYWKQYILKT